jgi:hypothetical protein
MKNFMLSLLIVLATACGGGGGGGGGDSVTPAALDSDLENGVWVMGYAAGGNNWEDRLTVDAQTNTMTIEIWRLSGGPTLVQTLVWNATPTSSNGATIDDGTTTFDLTYTITGNQLDVYFDDGDHNIYTR